MPGNYEILAVRNIARYIAPLVDRRQNPLPQNLTLLNRTPEVDRSDGEIVVSHQATVFAADIIADDQQAVVRTSDTFTPAINKIPNLKHGNLITQEMLALLQRINNGFVAPGEENIFRNYVARKYDDLIRGIRFRQEALLWQMALDSGTYNRLGIQFSGVSWGTPSNLKVTPSALWTDATNGKPITDVQAIRTTASSVYGKTYNRLELSTTAFNNAIATAEFKAQAQLFSGLTFPTGAVPFANPDLARNLMGAMLGLTVEINDFQYPEQNADGTTTYTRFLPVNKARLSNTGDDNNVGARAWASAVVVESLVGNLPGVTVLGADGLVPNARGPIGYATPRADLNPPNVVLWGVARGFPEKNDKASDAILTVG